MSEWEHEPVEVYALDPQDDGYRGVGCFECKRYPYNEIPEEGYKRGQAVLAGADHYPLNAEANYFCLDHVEPAAIVVDVYTDNPELRRMPIEEYRRLNKQ